MSRRRLTRRRQRRWCRGSRHQWGQHGRRRRGCCRRCCHGRCRRNCRCRNVRAVGRARGWAHRRARHCQGCTRARRVAGIDGEVVALHAIPCTPQFLIRVVKVGPQCGTKRDERGNVEPSRYTYVQIGQRHLVVRGTHAPKVTREKTQRGVVLGRQRTNSCAKQTLALLQISRCGGQLRAISLRGGIPQQPTFVRQRAQPTHHHTTTRFNVPHVEMQRAALVGQIAQLIDTFGATWNAIQSLCKWGGREEAKEEIENPTSKTHLR